MKKMLVLAVALVVIPAMGFAATTCNPGTYKGSLWSVAKDLNGKSGTLTVAKNGDKCVFNFKTEGSSETWELVGNTLVQKEYDNTGKVTDSYTATLNGDKYVINCKDKAKNDCDAGIDSRNYWQLGNTTDGYKYVVYGVGTENKGNATAPVAKRHEFTFKMDTTTPATKATTTTPAAPVKK